MLEERKDELGVEYYSVNPATLDQVCLAIVGRHDVQEENHEHAKDGVESSILLWPTRKW